MIRRRTDLGDCQTGILRLSEKGVENARKLKMRWIEDSKMIGRKKMNEERMMNDT